MTQRYYNPFAGSVLVYPAVQQEHYHAFCQTQETRANADNTPFPRMVDLWFAGLAVAAREGLDPVDLSGSKTSEMTRGSIFNGPDSWRIHAIMLLALQMDGNDDVISNAPRMISIANGLAAAGVPLVVDMLNEGSQPKIWNLSEAFGHLLSEDAV